MPERTHYSTRPITGLRSRRQDSKRWTAYKPVGLWYGVGGDWRRWCCAEQRDWIEGKWVYRVCLGRARILRLSTVSEVLAFDREYGVPIWPGLQFAQPDWNRVSHQWDGVEIAPYQGELLLWYYGWDCASGCVWNSSRGVTVRLLRAGSAGPKRRAPWMSNRVADGAHATVSPVEVPGVGSLE